VYACPAGASSGDSSSRSRPQRHTRALHHDAVGASLTLNSFDYFEHPSEMWIRQAPEFICQHSSSRRIL
jgi:hypothetical protein